MLDMPADAPLAVPLAVPLVVLIGAQVAVCVAALVYTARQGALVSGITFHVRPDFMLSFAVYFVSNLSAVSIDVLARVVATRFVSTAVWYIRYEGVHWCMLLQMVLALTSCGRLALRMSITHAVAGDFRFGWGYARRLLGFQCLLVAASVQVAGVTGLGFAARRARVAWLQEPFAHVCMCVGTTLHVAALVCLAFVGVKGRRYIKPLSSSHLYARVCLMVASNVPAVAWLWITHLSHVPVFRFRRVVMAHTAAQYRACAVTSDVCMSSLWLSVWSVPLLQLGVLHAMRTRILAHQSQTTVDYEALFELVMGHSEQLHAFLHFVASRNILEVMLCWQHIQQCGADEEDVLNDAVRENQLSVQAASALGVDIDGVAGGARLLPDGHSTQNPRRTSAPDERRGACAAGGARDTLNTRKMLGAPETSERLETVAVLGTAAGSADAASAGCPVSSVLSVPPTTTMRETQRYVADCELFLLYVMPLAACYVHLPKCLKAGTKALQITRRDHAKVVLVCRQLVGSLSLTRRADDTQAALFHCAAQRVKCNDLRVRVHTRQTCAHALWNVARQVHTIETGGADYTAYDVRAVYSRLLSLFARTSPQRDATHLEWRNALEAAVQQLLETELVWYAHVDKDVQQYACQVGTVTRA